MVCFSLNDCGGGVAGEAAFRTNLTQIAERIRQSAACILMTPNMMATYACAWADPNYKSSIPFFVGRQTDGTLGRYVDIIRDVARDTGTPLADGYAEWMRRQEGGQDMTKLLINGLNHPNAEGHRILADVLLKSFEAGLAEA